VVKIEHSEKKRERGPQGEKRSQREERPASVEDGYGAKQAEAAPPPLLKSTSQSFLPLLAEVWRRGWRYMWSPGYRVAHDRTIHRNRGGGKGKGPDRSRTTNKREKSADKKTRVLWFEKREEAEVTGGTVQETLGNAEEYNECLEKKKKEKIGREEKITSSSGSKTNKTKTLKQGQKCSRQRGVLGNNKGECKRTREGKGGRWPWAQSGGKGGTGRNDRKGKVKSERNREGRRKGKGRAKEIGRENGAVTRTISRWVKDIPSAISGGAEGSGVAVREGW